MIRPDFFIINQSRFCFLVPREIKHPRPDESSAMDRLEQIRSHEEDATLAHRSFDVHDMTKFFESEKVTSQEEFARQWSAHRFNKYLEHKKSQRTITPQESELLIKYQAFLRANPKEAPDIDKKLTEIERELKTLSDTDPRRAPLEKEQQDLAELLLVEFAGKVQMSKYFSQKGHVQQMSRDLREQQEGGLEQSVSSLYRDVKKNWRKMSGGEKWFMVIGAVVTTYMLSSSDNKTVQDIKKCLWGGTKLFFVGAFANKLAKLATGKSGLDWIEKLTQNAAENTERTARNFDCSEEDARIFLQSFPHLMTYKFKDFMPAYQSQKDEIERAREELNCDYKTLAKKRPQLFRKFKKIGDYEPWEVYTALHVFFTKYPESTVQSKYDSQPNISFTEMATREMADDPRGAFGGSVLGDSFGGVSSVIAETLETFKKKCKDWGLVDTASQVGNQFRVFYRNYQLVFEEIGNGVFNLVGILAGRIVAPFYFLAKGINWTREKIDLYLDHQMSVYAEISKEHTPAVSDLNTYFRICGNGQLGIFETSLRSAMTAGSYNATTHSFATDPYFENTKEQAGYYIVQIPWENVFSDHKNFIHHYEQAMNKARTDLASKNVAPEYIETVASANTNSGGAKFNLFVRAPLKGSQEELYRSEGKWSVGPAHKMKHETRLSATFRAIPKVDQDEIMVSNGIKKPADFGSFKKYFEDHYASTGLTEKQVLHMMKNLKPEERFNIFKDLGVTDLYDTSSLEGTIKKFEGLRPFMAVTFQQHGIDNGASKANQIWNAESFRQIMASAEKYILQGSDRATYEETVVKAAMDAVTAKLIALGETRQEDEDKTLTKLMKDFGHYDPDDAPWLPW